MERVMTITFTIQVHMQKSIPEVEMIPFTIQVTVQQLMQTKETI